MRGRPLIEMLLFIVAWCALSWPLWRLTHAVPVEASRITVPAAVTVDATILPTWATIRLAHPAAALTLSQGDAVLFQQASVGLRTEVEFPLQIRAGRAPVAVAVTWPAEVTQSVIEVTLEPDGRPARSLHLWGSGEAQGLLEFRWTP